MDINHCDRYLFSGVAFMILTSQVRSEASGFSFAKPVRLAVVELGAPGRSNVRMELSGVYSEIIEILEKAKV